MSSPHIAPVGLGPSHKQAEYKIQMPFSSTISIVQFVTGPSPIQSLTCGPGQSLDRFPVERLAWAILVQYAG